MEFSLEPSLSHRLLLSHPPLLCFSLVVSIWWNSEYMKDALSTLFWKVVSQERCKLNMFFFLCICSTNFFHYSSIPLFSPSLSGTICVTILTSIFLSLSSLSGGAGRKCHSLGGRHGPDLLPAAELRWINRGHPESPSADSFLQWHKRCGCTYAVV